MEKQKSEFKRIDYIDLLRGWAVLLMIFWHSIDALLSETLKQSTIFNISQFIGGLVAPSFLFTAGAAFSIILFKRRDELLKFGPSTKKQIKRIVQIFIIAYLLHFPFNNIVNLKFWMSYEQYLNFIKVDVLHVIALGLLFMQLVFFLIRREKLYYYILIILSLFFVLYTPYVYQIEFNNIPVEIATFLNKKFYSLFPLFPWMAYTLLGGVVMSLVLTFNKEGKEYTIIKYLFLLGLFLIFLGVITELFSISTSLYYNFWLTSPNIFCIKIGSIFVLIYLFRYLSNAYHYKMKWFGIFSRESLFVYVLHLLIVYGKDSPITLERYFGNSLNWFEYFVVYALLLVAMLIAAKLWNKYKVTRQAQKV